MGAVGGGGETCPILARRNPRTPALSARLIQCTAIPAPPSTDDMGLQ